MMLMFLLSTHVLSQTIELGNWSSCYDHNNLYIKTRNILIYMNNTVIINTTNNYEKYKNIFNIGEICEDNSTPYVAIVVCTILILMCLCGCYYTVKCPTNVVPI